LTGVKQTFPVRVYYEDTDHGGVVYHANYLKFLERGRSEFLRTLGFELDVIDESFGVLFALTEAQIQFIKPARFNNMLIVESSLIALSGARMTFHQTIEHQETKRLLIKATVHLASIGRDGKVKRIPSLVASKLRSHLISEEYV